MVKYAKAIDYLMQNGCPSIVYRTKKEILSVPLSSEEQKEWQEQILQDEKVQYLLSLQREDGWLGKSFHGEDEPESGIRLLCEKGLDTSNPDVLRALQAIEDRGDLFDQGCLSRVGRVLDEANLGGSKMMKACIYVQSGFVQYELLQEQIEKALASFRYVTTINDLEEVYTERKGKYVFKPDAPWPSIYHLRLLAFTDCWRTAENQQMLIHALCKLCTFGKIPAINYLHKSQLISTASFCMNDFDVNLEELNAKEWMMWFHRMELIARLGIAKEVDPILQQVKQLEELLQQNEGRFIRKLSHYYFNKWTPYLGLALENDWKEKGARECDLTFRSLLILSLVGDYNGFL